jgi:hypothetical protein
MKLPGYALSRVLRFLAQHQVKWHQRRHRQSLKPPQQALLAL